MSTTTRRTIDHQEIRRWAEKHGGQPEMIDDRSAGADPVGIRLNFPGKGDEFFFGEEPPIHEVKWSEFFQYFEEMQLAFVYDDAKELGDPSISYRFMRRENLS